MQPVFPGLVFRTLPQFFFGLHRLMLFNKKSDTLQIGSICSISWPTFFWDSFFVPQQTFENFESLEKHGSFQSSILVGLGHIVPRPVVMSRESGNLGTWRWRKQLLLVVVVVVVVVVVAIYCCCAYLAQIFENARFCDDRSWSSSSRYNLPFSMPGNTMLWWLLVSARPRQGRSQNNWRFFCGILRFVFSPRKTYGSTSRIRPHCSLHMFWFN